MFLLGSHGLLQRLLPRRRISLPAHPIDAPKRRLIRPNVLPQTTWMWTLLAEPRRFGVLGPRLLLLGSHGLFQRMFPRRRISLPAHPVDAPKRRLIRPDVLLRS